MPRKTRAQKAHARIRTAEAHDQPQQASSIRTKTAAYAYEETDSDKALRQITMKDATRTLLVTILLFAIQYIVFLRADVIQALLR